MSSDEKPAAAAAAAAAAATSGPFNEIVRAKFQAKICPGLLPALLRVKRLAFHSRIRGIS